MKNPPEIPIRDYMMEQHRGINTCGCFFAKVPLVFTQQKTFYRSVFLLTGRFLPAQVFPWSRLFIEYKV